MGRQATTQTKQNYLNGRNGSPQEVISVVSTHNSLLQNFTVHGLVFPFLDLNAERYSWTYGIVIINKLQLHTRF